MIHWFFIMNTLIGEGLSLPGRAGILLWEALKLLHSLLSHRGRERICRGKGLPDVEIQQFFSHQIGF